MAETKVISVGEHEQRIRALEHRLAQAEARIASLETRQPEPVFQHGRLTYWPNTAQKREP